MAPFTTATASDKSDNLRYIQAQFKHIFENFIHFREYVRPQLVHGPT